MAGEAEEVEVEVVETTAPTETTETVETKQPAEENIVTAEEGVDELKKKLEAERTARADAEAKARQASAQAQQAKTEIEDSQLREITGAIGQVKSNLEVAKTAYKTARAAGDVDAEVEAQEAIAQAKAELIQLEAGKAAREARAKQPAPQPNGDPVEALASTLTAKSAAWVRAHPEVARSQEAYADMLAAHRMALKKHPIESDGYFRAVEEALGYQPASIEVQRTTNEPTAEAPMSSASRPVAPAAAPVSRNGGGPGNPRPGTTRLTREEAEIALQSFPDLVKEKGPQAAYQAYAKSKDDLKKAGRLN